MWVVPLMLPHLIRTLLLGLSKFLLQIFGSVQPGLVSLLAQQVILCISMFLFSSLILNRAIERK